MNRPLLPSWTNTVLPKASEIGSEDLHLHRWLWRTPRRKQMMDREEQPLHEQELSRASARGRAKGALR